MSNQNPYEIRLNVLQMAKDYLDRQTEIHLEFAKEAFLKSVEAGKDFQDAWLKFAPKTYTIEELNAKATELYSFITNQNPCNKQKEKSCCK